MDTNFMALARGASGYQKQKMAELLGVDPQTYRRMELEPSRITLGMIEEVLPHLNEYSTRIIQDAINELFVKAN